MCEDNLYCKFNNVLAIYHRLVSHKAVHGDTDPISSYNMEKKKTFMALWWSRANKHNFTTSKIMLICLITVNLYYPSGFGTKAMTDMRIDA